MKPFLFLLFFFFGVVFFCLHNDWERAQRLTFSFQPFFPPFYFSSIDFFYQAPVILGQRRLPDPRVQASPKASTPRLIRVPSTLLFSLDNLNTFFCYCGQGGKTSLVPRDLVACRSLIDQQRRYMTPFVQVSLANAFAVTTRPSGRSQDRHSIWVVIKVPARCGFLPP